MAHTLGRGNQCAKDKQPGLRGLQGDQDGEGREESSRREDQIWESLTSLQRREQHLATRVLPPRDSVSDLKAQGQPLCLQQRLARQTPRALKPTRGPRRDGLKPASPPSLVQ